jgi:dTDP-4-amino-4,6-dideoxygalactose transaminase
MIPLLKPMFPASIELPSNGVFSNFGPRLLEVEKRFETQTLKRCSVVSNGTEAITIALRSLNIKHGMTCGVPEFAPACTLVAIKNAGLTPLVVPCNPHTMVIDHTACSKLDVVVVVNPFGYGVDTSLFDNLGPQVVYDFAGAWPSVACESPWPATYSFHATKTISCGEGGMVMSSNFEEHQKVRQLLNFGYVNERRVSEVDYSRNAKVDEIRASILLWALDNSHEFHRRLERRRAFHRRLTQEVGSIFFQPPKSPSLLVMQAGSGVQSLIESNVAKFTRYYYPPIAQLTHSLSTVLALPSDCDEKEEEVVIETLRDWQRSAR